MKSLGRNINSIDNKGTLKDLDSHGTNRNSLPQSWEIHTSFLGHPKLVQPALSEAGRCDRTYEKSQEGVIWPMASDPESGNLALPLGLAVDLALANGCSVESRNW
jgi:hypothetical protein